MNITITLIIGRLIVAGICGVGAIVLAYYTIEGWGWLLIATILLGCMTTETKNEVTKDT